MSRQSKAKAKKPLSLAVAKRRPARSTPRNYNGARTEPELEVAAVKMLAKEWISLRYVCRDLGIDFRTLKGIAARNPDVIASNKTALESLHDRLARLAGEEVEDRITSGRVKTKELATIYGIATDKSLATRALGLPQRIPPIATGAVDILTPFAQLVATLNASLTAPPTMKLADVREVKTGRKQHATSTPGEQSGAKLDGLAESRAIAPGIRGVIGETDHEPSPTTPKRRRAASHHHRAHNRAQRKAMAEVSKC